MFWLPSALKQSTKLCRSACNWKRSHWNVALPQEKKKTPFFSSVKGGRSSPAIKHSVTTLSLSAVSIYKINKISRRYANSPSSNGAQCRNTSGSSYLTGEEEKMKRLRLATLKEMTGNSRKFKKPQSCVKISSVTDRCCLWSSYTVCGPHPPVRGAFY